MDSIKSFITVKRQTANSFEIIKQQLLENFPSIISSETEAIELISEWNEEILMKESSYGNKTRVIDSNLEQREG